MGYKNIVVPLDGSTLAEYALRHVSKIAEPGASIHVLSVIAIDYSIFAGIALAGGYVESPVAQDAALYSYGPEVIQGREDYLKHAVEPLREMGYRVTIDVQRGDVVKSIVELACDGCDAIVMVTHGRSGLSKALLGSIAQEVILKTPCPVVLIPAQTVR